jgi:hypothetical protein
MVAEAGKAGLRITQANLHKLALGERASEEEHHYSEPDAGGPMHRSLTWGWKPLEIIPKRVKYRQWPRRSLFGFYFPWAEPRPVAATHVINDSVRERQRTDPSYRPPNLDQPGPPSTKLQA